MNCPACQTIFADRGQPGAFLKCPKCGVRIPRAKREVSAVAPAAEGEPEDDLGMGIHPALARRFKQQQRQQPAAQAAPHNDREPQPVAQAPATPPPEMDAEDRDARVTEPSLPRNRAAREAAARPAGRLPHIPGYDVEAIVGKGAMGEVFKGTEKASGRPVAIKLLAADLAAKDDFIHRFEREAAALKAVDHPAVVRIIDSGSIGDTHYLVMPFIEGKSLRSVLSGKPLPPLRAIRLACRIVEGLVAGHAKKVVHRDLKPENILIQDRLDEVTGTLIEHPVLVDFGLAGMGEDDPHPNLTKSRMTMGTVNYMAPEQRVCAKRVQTEADVYSAGVILYELLTGDLPMGIFPSPREKPGLAHLPSRIDDIIEAALAQEPKKRLTAPAFLAELEAILGHIDEGASRDTVVGRAPREYPDTLPGTPPEVSTKEPSTGGGRAIRGSTVGPQWVTSPPWVRRPQVWWGALALVLGAGVAVWQAPGTTMSTEEAAPAAPAAARPQALQTSWRVTPGWRIDDDKISWAAKEGSQRQGMSWATSMTESSAEALVVSTAVTFQADKSAATDVIAAVGVDVADERVAIGLLGNGGCAMLRGSGDEVKHRAIACQVNKGESVSMSMRCRLQHGVRSCQAYLDGHPLAAAEAVDHVAKIVPAIACSHTARCDFTGTQAFEEGPSLASK